MFLKTSFRIILRAISQWNENMDTRWPRAWPITPCFPSHRWLLLAITVVEHGLRSSRTRATMLYREMRENIWQGRRRGADRVLQSKMPRRTTRTPGA